MYNFQAPLSSHFRKIELSRNSDSPHGSADMAPWFCEGSEPVSQRIQGGWPEAKLVLQALLCFALEAADQKLSAITSVVEEAITGGKCSGAVNLFEPPVHLGEAKSHQSKLRILFLPWLTNGGVSVIIVARPAGLGA